MTDSIIQTTIVGCRTVILDWDGTLAHTQDRNYHALSTGLEPPPLGRRPTQPPLHPARRVPRRGVLPHQHQLPLQPRHLGGQRQPPQSTTIMYWTRNQATTVSVERLSRGSFWRRA